MSDVVVLDESHFEMNGKKYKAVPAQEYAYGVYHCEGCAFEKDNEGCCNSPMCYEVFREDDAEVIFVEDV